MELAATYSVDWTAIGTLVLAAVAILGLLGAWIKNDRSETRRNTRLDDLVEAQHQVKEQVTPNGGNTDKLGDRIVKLQRGMDELTQQFASVGDQLQSAAADRAAIAAALKEHEKKDDTVQAALLVAIRGASPSQ